jgi:hypothetical protein
MQGSEWAVVPSIGAIGKWRYLATLHVENLPLAGRHAQAKISRRDDTNTIYIRIYAHNGLT